MLQERSAEMLLRSGKLSRLHWRKQNVASQERQERERKQEEKEKGIV